MFYWCFSCSKITIPTQGLRCQYCSSEALEEMRDQNSPAQFIPFNVPPQQTQETQEEPQDQAVFTFYTIVRPQPILFMPLLPTISFLRIIGRSGEEEQRTPVDDEKYEKLEKVHSLASECSVCQESSGNGVKLNCKHEFHEDCIKPWFKNANTCPCCRATV